MNAKEKTNWFAFALSLILLFFTMLCIGSTAYSDIRENLSPEDIFAIAIFGWLFFQSLSYIIWFIRWLWKGERDD
jgi:hypothetical protein